MADNSLLPGTGDTYASDDINGVKTQRIKLTHGVDGVNDGDVARTNPLPVTSGDSDNLLEQLLIEARKTNFYLSLMTDIDIEDL